MRKSQFLPTCEHSVSQLDCNRSYPIGPHLTSDSVHFRVWAPEVNDLEVVIASVEKPDQFCSHTMVADENGYKDLGLTGLQPGDLYGFLFADDEKLYPDPASWKQPSGPHGLSEIVNPNFEWTDSKWTGPDLNFQILYELHIGTFTTQGTFAAAQSKLEHLKELGVTTVELMPVADFSGRFGWGYDGVNLFAPANTYGSPAELKSFINHAHLLGISVILDVVYNHFGADGNYAPRFSRHYFSDQNECEWGESINFDGELCGPVREFFIANARYWIEQYHFDGLRLDATQQIYDKSHPHIIKEIVSTIGSGVSNRTLYVVGENEPQHTELIREYGVDALWNDDFHHAARVKLTGKREGYYADYFGTPQELISAAKHGFLYQGQRSGCRSKPHGTSTLGLKPNNLVCFIENHDQVANSGKGQRVYQLADFGSYKAMLTLLLLGPNTPMLFQGQEFGSSAPFAYFADHEAPLSDAVYEGRKNSFRIFRSLNTEQMLKTIERPDSEELFHRCKINFEERFLHKEFYQFTKKLIDLRRKLQVYNSNELAVDGAVLAHDILCLRISGIESILLILNFGTDHKFRSSAEPLLAPPAHQRWNQLISSEEPQFGGLGCGGIFTESDVYVPARCSVVFEAADI